MRKKLLVTVAAAAMAAGALGGTGVAFANDAGAGGDAEILIIGGNPATEDYEFMASLQYRDQGDRFSPVRCGASLITPEWLVTAGHCIASLDGTPLEPSKFQVGIGSTDHQQATKMDIEAFVPHPGWGEFEESIADIALIKLAEPAEQNPTQIASPGPIDGKVRVLGWGFTVDGDSESMPRELQELDSTRLPYEDCIAGDEFDITPGDICVDIPGGDTGPCSGDSGGPALRQVHGEWRIIGVTSRGPGQTGCLHGPMVYTSTSHYQQWILETIVGDHTTH